MKLVVVPLEYIFIHAKKDVITEKNEEWRIKDSKEKRKLRAKKWLSGEVLMNLFIYSKKSNVRKNSEKIYVDLYRMKMIC